MPKVIHKYKLKSPGETKIFVPMNSKILSVASQGNHVVVWMEVECDTFGNTRRPDSSRVFVIEFTGIVFSDDTCSGSRKYIGTVQTYEESVVSHVYEVLK
jgi:hypothetical protein